MMRIYKKAILPLGFEASGISCGIKRGKKLDLALFYSKAPAQCACKFTTNKIQAAPLKLNKEYIKSNRWFQAIIVNSGNANCFTGNKGYKDAQDLTKSLAKVLNLKKERILSSSTGIIGKKLPLTKIKKAIPQLVRGLSKQGIDKAKMAIMTTDKFAKEMTVKFKLGERTVTVCGIAKGAGMLAPDMATMLCFIFSDAHITQRALKQALNISVDNSFNCITVDGCMSTNDTIIVLANAASQNSLIDVSSHFNLFQEALNIVCLGLAKLIIRDAEGATKFIRVTVDRAKSFQEARKVALSIANSNLFKTAMYGQNPNWGRIVAAIGASGIDVKEKALKIWLSPLHKKEIFVNVSINRGNSSAIVYTSDLTPEYIKINAEYN